MSDLTFTPATAASYEDALRGAAITMAPAQALDGIVQTQAAPTAFTPK